MAKRDELSKVLKEAEAEEPEFVLAPEQVAEKVTAMPIVESGVRLSKDPIKHEIFLFGRVSNKSLRVTSSPPRRRPPSSPSAKPVGRRTSRYVSRFSDEPMCTPRSPIGAFCCLAWLFDRTFSSRLIDAPMAPIHITAELFGVVEP